MIVYLSVLIVIFSLFSTNSWAVEKPVKATLVSDFSKESLGGSSFELDILEWVSDSGPLEVEFTRKHVSLTRALSLLSEITNACVLNVIKTEDRQEVAVYSKRPLTVYPPIRLITLAKHNIELPDPFDLYRLTDKHPWVVGVVATRRYGIKIDSFISRHRDILYQRPYTSSVKRFVDMLESGRIDGILEFTRSVEEYINISGRKDLKLRVTSLMQANKVVFGYLACAKTAEGRKIIEAVDTAYNSEPLKKRIIDAHIDFFGPKEKRLLMPILKHVYE